MSAPVSVPPSNADACVVCRRDVGGGLRACGICLRTWSVYCARCAARARFTNPRSVVGAA